MAISKSFLEQQFLLEGRAALVTGASGGIGHVFALALAHAGTMVGIHGRSEDRLQETATLIEEAGGCFVSLTAELSDVAVYSMSKSALAHLSKTMAVEWAKDNIQVNCLAPGFMLTPLTEEPLWGNDKRRNWLLERIPGQRPGKPEELVGALLLLASARSSYLTGQTLSIDGGFLAGGWWQDYDS